MTQLAGFAGAVRWGPHAVAAVQPHQVPRIRPLFAPPLPRPTHPLFAPTPPSLAPTAAHTDELHLVSQRAHPVDVDQRIDDRLEEEQVDADAVHDEREPGAVGVDDGDGVDRQPADDARGEHEGGDASRAAVARPHSAGLRDVALGGAAAARDRQTNVDETDARDAEFQQMDDQREQVVQDGDRRVVASVAECVLRVRTVVGVTRTDESARVEIQRGVSKETR